MVSILVLIFASLALLTESFVIKTNTKWMTSTKYNTNSIVVTNNKPLFAKEDIFSDDLFEDDDEEEDAPQTKKNTETPKAKRKYLEEDWKVSDEDSKQFTGMKSKGAASNIPNDAKFPVFALMYKIRREYVETSIDAVLADHNGCVERYRRCMNSEVIRLGNSRGLVLLWLGLNEDDKEQTRNDIMEFMEEDPLIAKDVIERWNIIDLTDKPDPKDLPADRTQRKPATTSPDA